MDSFPKHDPNLIIQAAEDKKAAGNLQGAQMLFEGALLEWGDEAREGAGGAELREALATLFLAYADFHRINKAWKSAMDTYEQAISDPTSGTVGRVFLEYARFAEEREKKVTAQKVYIRALVGDSEQQAAVTDEQDTALLWNEFLEMMRRNNPSLSLLDLKQAVQNEHTRKRMQPDQNTSISNLDEKRSRTNDMMPPLERRTYVVTSDEVEAETVKMKAIVAQMPPEISAAWMARDGDSPAQAPEHPLFSPTRPKMSDASGRELIGDEMALRITERLLSDSGSVLLEVCRTLWLTTALKEKETSQALESLDDSMMKEHRALEASHDARLSVAGAASSAVKMMNDNERNGFEESCSQRRQKILSRYAWEFRNLMCVQQTILKKLGVPGFDGPTVDAHTLDFQSNICSLLHTAFFLRKNLGLEQHKKMLESQRERLKKDRARDSPKLGPPIPTRGMSPVPPPVILSPGPPINHFIAPPPQPPIYRQQPPPPNYGMIPQPYANMMQPVIPPHGMPPIQQPPPLPIQQPPMPQMMPPPAHFGQQPPYYRQ